MTDKGLIDTYSNHSVEETVVRLRDIFDSKGITLFAEVDHSGEAEKVGMHMPPTKLLIFGNPKAGTPLMLASPSVAIDLPLKFLIWEGKEGRTRISYNSTLYLQERHGIPDSLVGNISMIAQLATIAVT
jgi:uncharacterized protein (DUF302 family)